MLFIGFVVGNWNSTCPCNIYISINMNRLTQQWTVNRMLAQFLLVTGSIDAYNIYIPTDAKKTPADANGELMIKL